MNSDRSFLPGRSRRRRRHASRRILSLVLVAFFLLVASAQAHSVTASTACNRTTTGNTVTFTWTAFANPPGPLNNGLNTPPWKIVYTPTGGSPLTLSGSVSFASPAYFLTVQIPSAAGTAVASSFWTASQTSDGNTGGGSINLTVPSCVASPKIVTTASASVVAGGTISDSAVLSGGRAPTGTITFKLYRASDTTCSNALSTGTAAVSGNGTYTSPAVTATTAGTYQWTASYGGDANNKAVAEGCNSGAAEQVVVTPPPPNNPTIVTTASPGVPVGGAISDNAVLSGGSSPTGTITFNLYSSSDSACSNSLATGTVPVTGNGTYTSPAVTENTVGTYQWVATYSGDANNAGVTDGCGQAAEQVVVSGLHPAIVTTASPGKTLTGNPISDRAVLSGGTSPTGAITFRLYKASDTTCSTPVLTTSIVTVTGDGPYTSPAVTVSTAGTYQWVATYSGDANNASVTDGCGQAAEQVTLTTPPPKVIKCTTKPHLTGVFGKVGSSVTARVSSLGVKSVTFYLDGRKLATVTKAHGGFYRITIKTKGLSFGRHTVKAKTVRTGKVCRPIALSSAFIHPRPNPNPKPTG